jgi:hypothetical protein
LLGGDIDSAAGLDGLSAITTFFGTGGVFTGGGLNALFPDEGAVSPGYDALGALDVFFGNNDGTTGGGVFTGGGVNALNNYAALSAIPVFIGTDPATGEGTGVLNGGGIDALGGYAALSAVDTFFGDNNGEGGVFTGGGIDALAPDADGNGGYAALSALPVFFGRATTDNGTATSFGPGLFTGGGVDALKNYAALSTIPALVDDPTTHSAPMALTPFAAAAQQQAAPQAASLAAQATIAQDPGSTTPTTPTAGSNPVNTFVASLPKPQAFTPPAPPQVDPTVTTPDKGGNRFNGSYSKKFEPTTTTSDSPFLLESGTPGGEGMRGYGSFLKKLGIGGGGAADGAGAATGTK